MKKSSYLWFAALNGVAIISVALYFLFFQPPPSFDWRTSFRAKDTDPFGAYVFFHTLNDYFPGQEIKTVRKSFKQLYNDSLPGPYNLIWLQPSLYLSMNETYYLTSLAEQGHTIFIASESFQLEIAKDLEKDLGLSPQTHCPQNFSALQIDRDTFPRRFKVDSLPEYKPTYFKLKKLFCLTYWEKYNPEFVTPLGSDDSGRVNFIRLDYIKEFSEVEGGVITLKTTPIDEKNEKHKKAGRVFLHNTPSAFSNYEMLYGDGANYAAQVMAHLPRQKTYWLDVESETKDSPWADRNLLRFILQEPPLRNAFILLLFGAFLYVLFTAKRRQRAIPLVPPLQNTTVAFIQTVAKLYYRKKARSNILRKRYSILFEFIRERYLLRPTDADFERRLAAKTDLSEAQIAALMRGWEVVRIESEIEQGAWLAIQKQIEAFYLAIKVNR